MEIINDVYLILGIFISLFYEFRQVRREMQTEFNQLSYKKEIFELKFTLKYKYIEDSVGITDTNEFIFESHDGKDKNIIVVSIKGKQIFCKKISDQITPFRMIDNQSAIFFNSTRKRWQFIRAQQRQVQQIQIDNEQFWTNGQFQLEHFEQTKELCLIQKNRQTEKLKICFYLYNRQAGTIKRTQVYQSQQNQWSADEQIYVINEKSCLGWCGTIKNDFKLRLYQRYKGFTNLNIDVGNVSTIFLEHEFLVHSIVKYAPSYFYLAVVPSKIIKSNQDSKYFPLIYFKTSKNYQQIEQIDFVSVSWFKNDVIFNRIEYFHVGDFSFLKTYSLQKQLIKKCPIYIINDQTRHVVKEEDSNFSANLKMNKCTNRKNTLLECEYYSENCEEMTVTVMEIKKVNSLAFQRMLIVFDQIQKLSKKYQKAIFIFGSNKSGKSTLRHFLAGDALLHAQNEQLEFFQVKSQINEGVIYEHQAEKDRVIWISQAANANAIIIDIANWNDQLEFYKLQTQIILARTKQMFQKLHFYIDVSNHTVQIVSSVLQMIAQKQQSVAQFISIVLTKVQDESSRQVFIDKNEQIALENQQIASLIMNICKQERLYDFMNQQFSESEGLELLDKILNSNLMQLPKQVEIYSTLQEQIDANQYFKQAILLQSSYLLKLFNNQLKYISFGLTKLPQGFSIDELNSMIHHSADQFSFTNQIRMGKIANSFVQFIAQFKFLVHNVNNLQKISEVERAFFKMIQLFPTAFLQKESHFIQQGFAYFTSILKICHYLRINQHDSKPFDQIFKIFQDQQQGILGNQLKATIKSLGQIYVQLKNSPQFKQLCSLVNQTVIIRKLIPMSYEEERRLYIKKKENKLQIICGLPCNVLKLDLMMQELKPYCQKQSLNEKDYRIVNFYLRQCSKICQYHELYYESLIFLSVIPDFMGIGIALDGLIAKSRRDSSFSSKIFQEREVIDLINQLIILCRTCLRDNLLRKLICIKNLNDQMTIPAKKIRQYQMKQKMSNLPSKQHLQSYMQMLKDRKKDLPFYNLKGDLNLKKLLDKNKDILIKKCRKFEESDEKRYYEDVESLHWLIEMLPMPS